MDVEDDREYVRNTNHILHIHILAPDQWLHTRSDGVARSCRVSSLTRVRTLIDALDGWTLGSNGKFVSWALCLYVVRVIWGTT